MDGENSRSNNDYSLIDRLLHRMAFAHPLLQRALGEIESDIFASKFSGINVERPVFVTGLPRAGTTLLLEMLYATQEFATFTYREMPFPLAPLFWTSATGSSRKTGERRERAHGDGMEISFDSPEAFEEVAWLAYLRSVYVKDDRLLPLAPEMIGAEFRETFAALARKIIALQSAPGESRRYLSKNNANISRLEAIRSIFPDAAVFVCLREPQSHVRSLMTQHARFLAIHDDDPFAREYMRWIGHFDFGANFRPIDFAGRGLTNKDTATADFWLRYWIDAYSFAEMRAGADVYFVCYEKFFSGKGAFAAIAKAANLKSADAFVKGAPAIRKPTTTDAPVEGADPALLSEAATLYSRLAARALA